MCNFGASIFVSPRRKWRPSRSQLQLGKSGSIARALTQRYDFEAFFNNQKQQPCKGAESKPSLCVLASLLAYSRTYQFRARALQIYHPARERRRKAIIVCPSSTFGLLPFSFVRPLRMYVRFVRYAAVLPPPPRRHHCENFFSS